VTTAPQTQAALAARRRKVDAMLDRVRATITQMIRDHAPVTVQAISRRADVSRAFLYQNAQARALVTDALADAGTQRQHAVHAADQAAELAWRERALNAEDALKTAHGEIRTQRARIAELLGRIRDLELDLPQDAVQRLATENTTLKQHNRTLEAEVKTLTDRLTAARGNNRSLEKQLSELQAELLDPAPLRQLRPVTPMVVPD
jgi:chromosome segregation ATPase